MGAEPLHDDERQGAGGYQLTGMDAKVGDWVVTPRRGKAVEINALWYNALCLLERWLGEEGREPAAKGPMKSLVAGGMHYIRSGDGSEDLFYLKSDPDERLNVAGAPAAVEILRRFRAGLAAMLRKR